MGDAGSHVSLCAVKSAWRTSKGQWLGWRGGVNSAEWPTATEPISHSNAVAFGALGNKLNKNTVLRAPTLYLVRTALTVSAGLDIGLCGSAVGHDRMECEGFRGLNLNVFENFDAISHDE